MGFAPGGVPDTLTHKVHLRWDEWNVTLFFSPMNRRIAEGLPPGGFVLFLNGQFVKDPASDTIRWSSQEDINAYIMNYQGPKVFFCIGTGIDLFSDEARV